MSPVPLTILCIIAYIAGIVVLLRITPQLVKRKYDEGIFMAVAAADILGGLLVFSAVGITFALYNGTGAVRVFDFFLLAIIFGVALRLAFRCFRPRYRVVGIERVSSILAGSYCVLLVAAALYAIVATVV